MASSSVTSTLRVTETPNPLTVDIDVADTAGIVRLLHASDSQMFTGFAGLPHVYSDEMVGKVVRVVRGVEAALRHPHGRIVFSGCGTSGRLAHLTARAYNAWLAKCGAPGASSGVRKFDYLLAGGDAALLMAQESAEDQPTLGRSDILEWQAAQGIPDDAPVVVIGISCGLSATYVGSMLLEVIAGGTTTGGTGTGKPGWMPVVLGFNPVDSVASVRVDKWDTTFHAVMTRMLGGGGGATGDPAAAAAAAAKRCVILNPVTGPETIAGSSRMKGGSMTKILLETICTLAMTLVHGSGGAAAGSAASAAAAAAVDDAALARAVRSAIFDYQSALTRLYWSATGIERLVDAACAAATTDVPVDPLARPALGSGRLFVSPTGAGRILYIGVGAAGLLGLVDASECPPTYGAHYNAVRGFVAGAWGALDNKEGPKVVPVPPHMRADRHCASAALPEYVGFGIETFTQDVLPTVSPADIVIFAYVHEADAEPGSVAALHFLQALECLRGAKAAGAVVRHAVVLPEEAGGVAAAPAAAATTSSAAPAGAAVTAASPTALAAPAVTAASALAAVTAITGGSEAGSLVITLPSLRWTPDLPTAAAAPAVAASAAAGGGGGGGTAAAIAALVEDAAAASRRAFSVSQGPASLGELVMKLVFNAATTGAHIRTGTIYHNRMANVSLTNIKLFHRAVKIVADLTGANADIAGRSVLRAIYHRDDIISSRGGYIAPNFAPAAVPSTTAPAAIASTGAGAAAAAAAGGAATAAGGELPVEGLTFAALASLPVSRHVTAAASQRSIVPVAMLLAGDELRNIKSMAGGGAVRPLLTEAEARAALRRQPVVRLALQEALGGPPSSAR